MLTKIRTRLVDFLKQEDGPTAVEYAVMLALIIIVCLAAIQIIGRNANSAFGTVGASIGATVSAS
jgi:pilus assembly protein Flp/PilA